MLIKLGPVGMPTEGSRFDEKGRSAEVYQLFISYESDKVVGLQVQYIDEESSSLVLTDVYGKMSGSHFRAIKFDYPSEYITWVKIHGSRYGVEWIAMKTNLGKSHGPFPSRNNPIDDYMLATGYFLGEENQFGGFHGTGDETQGLRSLGVHVRPVSSLDAPVAGRVAGEEALKVD
uniref:Jacalin-type lectin domain-containing protein n=1 Tax=Kalanchoe fedtschenkoi TaxID=63787 RepID=A0A7N0UJE7_KALFE